MNHIIDKIGFHTINHLYFAAFFADAVDSIHAIRERLYYAVIGNRNRLMSKFISPLNQFRSRSHPVHRRHVRVHMQFDPFLLCKIPAWNLFHRCDTVRAQHTFVVKPVVFHQTMHDNCITIA